MLFKKSDAVADEGVAAVNTRHHPMRPKTIANDAFAPPLAASDEDHRERLRRAYGQHDS
jgi:hypothetical protein